MNSTTQQLKWLSRILTPGRTISGDVCLVRLCVTGSDSDHLDEIPWKILGNREHRLREEISGVVKESLGPEFEVRSLAVGRGSIEILVLIGTAYYVVSRYKNFVDSLELMVRQLRQAVRHFFEMSAPTHVSVSGSWIPGPGLLQAEGIPQQARASTDRLVLFYLVISHAGMLALLVWLVIEAFTP